MMKEHVINLSDAEELEQLMEDTDLFTSILSYLKVPAAVIAMLAEQKDETLVTAYVEALEDKHKTSTVYYERDTENPALIRNIKYFRGIVPLSIDRWVEFIKENVELCCDILSPVEAEEPFTIQDSKGNTKVALMLPFKVDPRIGIVFTHEANGSKTVARAYAKRDGCTFYLPMKFFNKTSSRYNKVVENHYPESIKLLLIALAGINVDSLRNKIWIAVDGMDSSKVLSMEEIKRILESCPMHQPAEILATYKEQVDENEDRVNDVLYRSTRFKITLGEALLDLANDFPTDTGLRDFLGQLVAQDTMADRVGRSLIIY